MSDQLTTNVPAPSFGANGFTAPAQSAVLEGVQEDWQTAFGGTLDFSTPTGAPVNANAPSQATSSIAAIISNIYNLFCLITQQVDPAYAVGRMQDAIGRIYFQTRIPGQPTILNILITGAASTPIPLYSTVEDPLGNVYASIASGVIPTGGSFTQAFACQALGPTPIPETVTITPAISGWDTAAVSSGVLGSNVEGAQAFETRRQNSVASNSFGAIGSILGAVSDVAGVIDLWGYNNATAAPVTVFGVTIPANAIYIAVVGGTSAAVAQAIFSKKGPGAPYYGNTSVTVYDTNPIYQVPPSYTVAFEIPTGINIYFAVDIVPGPNVPANVAALVQSAIISAFAGQTQSIPRARIASQITALQFVPALTALGAWAQNGVRSIALGSINSPACTITASISGTTMTVTAVSAATLAADQYVDGAGVLVGTTIVTQTGGSPGDTGTYTISATQTVGSETMHTVAPSLSSIQVQANQEPTTEASIISVEVS